MNTPYTTLPWTPEYFQSRVGHPPQQDDIERCNCPEAGLPGHWQCGVCSRHDYPVFLCSHCANTPLEKINRFHLPSKEIIE